MNHFECPYHPFTYEHSVFMESYDSSNGKIKRWVECVDYKYVEDPVTKRMIILVCDEFKLVIDGVENVIKKGDLCANNSDSWWEIYKGFYK